MIFLKQVGGFFLELFSALTWEPLKWLYHFHICRGEWHQKNGTEFGSAWMLGGGAMKRYYVYKTRTCTICGTVKEVLLSQEDWISGR